MSKGKLLFDVTVNWRYKTKYLLKSQQLAGQKQILV